MMSCGSAASLAESLRLSVMAAILSAATPPEAKPLLLRSERKAGGFPHGKAAKPQPIGQSRAQ